MLSEGHRDPPSLRAERSNPEPRSADVDRFVASVRIATTRGEAVEEDGTRCAYPEARFQTDGLLDARLVMLVWAETADGRHIMSMEEVQGPRSGPVPTAAGLISTIVAGMDGRDAGTVAEVAIGGKVLRPATGYSRAERRGARPPADRRQGQAAGDVAPRPRRARPLPRGRAGWQGRINAALRKAVGL